MSTLQDRFAAFCEKIEKEHTTQENIVATCKLLPETFDERDIQIMLTDADDCDEFLEKYAKVDPESAGKFKVRQELISFIEKFAEDPASKAAPAAAAPAAAAGNTLQDKFAAFCESIEKEHTTQENIVATCKLLPETFDERDIQIMLTDADDCDEFLEKYAKIDPESAGKFKVRQELISFIEKFAEAQQQ